MKKIMFNDKYGLTQAVLEGRKTQTRRIVNMSKLSKMQIDSLDDENSDLGILTMCNLLDDSRYKVGEEVAVAMCYGDCGTWLFPYDEYGDKAGYTNKMFVEADLMPYRIRITNIRVERLQDISEDDCWNEGIYRYSYTDEYCFRDWQDPGRINGFPTLREAFAALIDKTCGKGTWDSNPWVFVYDFKLIK